MSASRSQPCGPRPSDFGVPKYAPSAPHQVTCDLCQWPMDVPQHCIDRGLIEGLLVCGQCIEDEAQSRVSQ